MKNYFKTTTIFENDFKCAIPELFMVGCILLIFTFAIFFSKKNKKKIKIINAIQTLFLVSLILVLYLILNNINYNVIFFYQQFENNLLITSMKIIIILGLLCIMLNTKTYSKYENIKTYEHIVLFALATFGTIGIISSNDLLPLYLTLELQGLSLYILGSYKQTSLFSAEAGLKYYIISSVGSAFFLLGSSYVYGGLGTTNFSAINSILLIPDFGEDEVDLFLVGLTIITISILLKIGAAPFHNWVPDVYEGVPNLVTMFFATVPKIGLFVIIIKLYYKVYPYYTENTDKIIYIAALLSLIIGTIGALFQLSIKRLLAYSAISHTGFLLLSIWANTVESLQSFLIYIIIYIILMINIFSILLSVYSQNSKFYIKNLTDITYLVNINPILSICLIISLFSLVGIPPLAGFYGKMYIVNILIKLNVWIAVFVAIIFSSIGAFYYIRLISTLKFKKPEKEFLPIKLGQSQSLIISITTLFNVLLVLYPDTFFKITYQIAYSFYI